MNGNKKYCRKEKNEEFRGFSLFSYHMFMKMKFMYCSTIDSLKSITAIAVEGAFFGRVAQALGGSCFFSSPTTKL